MHNIQNFKAVTLNLSSAGLTAGTTSTYTTTATSNAAVKGKFTAALTAQTNTASPTTDAATGLPFKAVGANMALALVWGLNLAGQIQLVQGDAIAQQASLAASPNVPGTLITPPQFPSVPDDFVPIAYMIVRTATSGAFTPGTTSWTATGVVTVTQNVSTLPDRPQAS